jgi:hypothetical protein
LDLPDPVISDNTNLPALSEAELHPVPVAELREHESTIKIINLNPRKLRRTKKLPPGKLEGFEYEYLVFKNTRKSAYNQKRKSHK